MSIKSFLFLMTLSFLTFSTALSANKIAPILSFLLDETETCPGIPSSYFSGLYSMEQLSGADPYYAIQTFGNAPQLVQIATNGRQRSFQIDYYGDEPSVARIYNFTITLKCDGTLEVFGENLGPQLGCTPEIIDDPSIGFSTGIPASTYSVSETDDDIVLVNVTDFEPDGGCPGENAYQVELRFTEH